MYVSNLALENYDILKSKLLITNKNDKGIYFMSDSTRKYF